MEKRLKIVIGNIEREIGTLKIEKKKLEWSLKYAPSMSKGYRERLEEVNEAIREKNVMLDKLNWILEG